MASTIHDERPSTSSYVSENSKNSSATTTTTMTAVPLPHPQQQYHHRQQQYWQGSYNNQSTNFPRNIGHWQQQTSPGPPQNISYGGFNGRGPPFNPSLNWNPQQPRNFLPQAPFYIQQPNAVQWNTYGYAYTTPPNIIHQQPPPPWPPSSHPQQQHQHQQPPRNIKSSNLAVITDSNREQQQQQQKPSGPNECWNNAVVAWEQRTMIHNKIGLIINDRYRIVQNIDSGSYGTIFVAEDLKKNNERVAVKFDAGSFVYLQIYEIP
jgi:hypothetical protein